MSIGIMVNLNVEDIANSIKKLKKEDKETLLLLLSGEGKEIKKRLHEIKSKKVKTLTREETFAEADGKIVGTDLSVLYSEEVPRSP